MKSVANGRNVTVFGPNMGIVSTGDGATNTIIQAVDPVLLQMRQTAANLATTIEYARRSEFARRQFLHPLHVSWQYVRRDFGGGLHGGSQPHLEQSSPETSDLSEAFQRVPAQRLVVLGGLGSGKSIFAMRFVLGRLKVRGADDPVPVIFSMGSWDPRTSLISWLIDRLLFDYPGLRAPALSGATSLGSALLTTGRILPVLDGFDEITEKSQQRALHELNVAELPMLLTSRAVEYISAVTAVGPLKGAETIVLDDLTLDELVGYLSPPGPGVGHRKWDPVLNRLREEPEDPVCANVRAALTTPLMAGLARAVYGDTVHRDPADLLDGECFATRGELEAHLLDQFVPTVYDQPAADPRLTEQRPSPWHGHGEDAERWLGYLARHQTGKDFEWWTLVDAVPRLQRALVGGLLGVVVGGPVGWLLFGARGAMLCALTCSFLSALVAISKAPQPIHMDIRVTGRARDALLQIVINLLGGLLVGLLGWPAVRHWGWFMLPAAGAVANGIGSGLSSWARHVGAKAQLKEIGLGLFGGSALGLALAIPGWLAHLSTGGYVKWLVLGLTAGLATGLGAGLRVPMMLATVIEPSVLLAANRRYAIFQTLTIGSAFGIIAGVIGGPKYLAAGPVIGVAFGLGAHAWGRWLVLARIALPLRGRLPWRVWSFLTDAHEREVFRQAGAVYEFRHIRLKESLAAHDDKRRKSQVWRDASSDPEKRRQRR